jgi:hypothetical protein
MARFKYQDLLDICPEKPCPGERYQERNCVGYRWVHEPLWHDDFIPPAIGTRNPRSQCGGYALSFFKTPKHARKRWEILAERIDVAARFGTRTVEIDVIGVDGKCCEPSGKFKHFDLHEYDRDHGWEARIKNSHPMKEEA